MRKHPAGKKALWSSKCKLKLYTASTFTGHSSIRSIALKKPFSGKCVKVQADTLDNIIKDLGIDRVDVLLMNIESAEFEALKGAKKALKKCRKIRMPFWSYMVMHNCH
jgi:FkbM family methyltransferase